MFAWDVTKHSDQCPSLVGANWIRDGAGIDFIEMYAYEKCLLFIQSRVASNRKVLRKKWINLRIFKCFRLSHKLETLRMDAEIFWTRVTYMRDCILILGEGN